MIWSIIILIIAALGIVLCGPIMSNVEQAKYTVIEKYDDIEIRDYAPMIVAEVQVSGDRQNSINKGFRTIADYIFGNNISHQKLKMTAPVTQQINEKIAMTASITQTINGKSWNIRFIMPENYTMKTLPQPNNDAVKIKEITKSCYVVIRFSGTASKKNLKKYSEKLELFIKYNRLKTVSQPTYAFFNPPWTLPFLRRNEIMVEVSN